MLDNVISMNLNWYQKVISIDSSLENISEKNVLNAET